MQKMFAKILFPFCCSRFKCFILHKSHLYAQLAFSTERKMEKIRNIGIIAHIDAGKTTTTERMLYYSGFIHLMGEVHDGDTVMDYLPQERERGITITSAAISFEWKKHKVNLVDTPGHVDFTIEVERALCAVDGAVVILDSSAGVEVQTLTVWKQAKRYSIPSIVYLNKMDKPNADFNMSMSSLQRKLKVKPLVLQRPVGVGRDFHGVVDLVLMRKLIWRSDGPNKDGAVFRSENINLKTDFELAKQREQLVETVADLDDSYGSKFILEGEDSLTDNELIAAIRRITLKRLAVPVLCGSSYKNIGVQPLLDSIVLYLPNPNERTMSIKSSGKNDVCALVFKIVHDKIRGPLTFLRLYSGTIESGQRIYNTNRKKTERITNLMIPLANDFKDVQSMSSGNIAVVAGLKEAVTGDTLVSSSSSLVIKGAASSDEVDVESEAILKVPDPVFFCSVEPPSLSSQNKLQHALSCLEREDPSFHVKYDEEMDQIIISGMGELHIDVIRDRIFREYGVKPYLGPLQVAYRESVLNEVIHEHVLSKTLGGNKNFVKIMLALVPSHNETKFKQVKVIVTNENELGKIRSDHLKAINAGVYSALQHGPVIGFPVVNVKVNLLLLEVSRGTSVEMVSAAASKCVQEMLGNAHTLLLEPIMRLSITVDKGYAGVILNDLSQKRSQILSMEAFGDIEVIHSKTPLSELKGYSTTLRALTSGKCSFTMEFDCYESMDYAEQAKAVESVTGFTSL